MPKVRTPPCGFGISTLRTAAGMYSPTNSACLTFAQCALSHGFNSATVSPSTPGTLSLAQQPPNQPLHPLPIPAGSACLRRCGPHSRALLLYWLASRSAVLLPCFTFGPSRSRDRYYGLG